MGKLDEGPGGFIEKLEGSLAGRDADLILLAAELIRLHNLPLSNVKASTKRTQVTDVLSWLPNPPTVPQEIAFTFTLAGSLNGGAGYSIHEWQHIAWLADLTTQIRKEPPEVRASLASDPWKFRDFLTTVSSEADSPAMRNTLLSLAFPGTFQPVISDQVRLKIRDAYADNIGGSSGGDPVHVDHDLDAIHHSLCPQNDYIDWYAEPWKSGWASPVRATSRAWSVRGRSEDPSLVDRWLAEGYVSLSADQLDDVHEGASRATIRTLVSEAYDHWDYIQRQTQTNDVYAFASRMKSDDLVLVRDGDDAHLGTISGPMELADEPPRLRRPVNWTSSLPFADLSPSISELLGQQRQVTDLTQVRDQLASIPIDGPQPLVLHPATPDLATETTIGIPWLNDFIGLLDRRRQVILYGPPGTGKTYLARAVSRHLAPEHTVIVQFHPSYSYEDFFEGYRPTPLEDGGVGFSLTPGPLREMASNAAQEPETPYVLLIDEINRGNIAKIFGELYFLLEYRTEHVRLQYSPDDQFTLPDNLFIIATMNTADRSIALVDALIRRRFAFVEMDPSTPPVQGLLGRWLRAHGACPMRAHLLDALNAKLAPRDPDLRVGPSYLMRPEAATDAGLADIWRYDILPLLDEQLYDRLSATEVRSMFSLDALRGSLGAIEAPADFDQTTPPPAQTPKP